MGELASRFASLVDESRPPPMVSRDAYHNARIQEAQAMYMRQRADDTRIVTDVDPLQAEIARTVTAKVALIAAERRAEAAERVIVELVKSDGKCVGMARVVGRTTLLADLDSGMPMDLIDVGGHVAILASQSAPCVDNLERRGTEPIEAGEKLLQEYERQRKQEKVPA